MAVPATAAGTVTAEVFTSCDGGGTLTVSMRNGTDVMQRVLYDVDRGNDGTLDFGDGAEIVPGGRVDLPTSGRGDGVYRVVVRTEDGASVADQTVEIACQSQPAASYFVTRYDQTVWRVTDAEIKALTFAEWQADGAPVPKPAPTDYVRYAWSSTISAVTFFGNTRDRWVWKHVSFEEWSRAGRPAPRNAGWIKDSSFYQWATSDQIFVQDVGGVRHALSYNEWRDSGFEPFERRSNVGFIKLTWDGTIAYIEDLQNGRSARAVGYEEWRSNDFPRPLTASRFTGDQVYRDYGSSDIWYAGPTVNRRINGQEWAAMGNPAPQVRNVPASPGDTKNCSDFGSRAEAQRAFDYWYPAYGDVFRLDADKDGIACEDYKY